MSGEPDFEFHWATASDEPDIRALVGSVAMPGAVSVRFAREPDYFLGTTIMGDRCDVLVARQRSDARLAAIACRAERPAFVNGIESRLGYIGQIRVAETFRGRWLVQRGASRFKQAGGADLLYLGVIAGENPRARMLLTGRRLPGGVQVRRLCGITTKGILLRRTLPPRPSGIDVRGGTLGSLPEIVAFLRRNGPRRQFFPAYTVDDFAGGERLRGLAPGDIMVAFREGAIVGVMAAWDQASYKQDIVDAYGPTLRRLRPLYDLTARLFGFAALTSPGRAIPLSFAACLSVVDDDIAVMRALLAACEQHALGQGKSFLMLGLAETDPLLAATRGRLHVTYRSDLYAAAWSSTALSKLDERIPYVEIAAL